MHQLASTLLLRSRIKIPGGVLVHNILLIDDDVAFSRMCANAFLDYPEFQIELIHNPLEALKQVRLFPWKYSVVLVDYLMPSLSGSETTTELLKINKYLIIAILSGDQTRDAIKLSHEAGVAKFLDKGESTTSLIEVIRGLCKKYEETTQVYYSEVSKTKNEELINSIGMIGKSQGLADLAETITSYSRSSANVVIEGESGCGKELVARAIHNLSPRKNRPFIGINVGNLREELFESELFGHKKGAFTGAINDKVGVFKLANGGTLFLDEIGDLKKELQVKLLRVLQEGEFYPVGSNLKEKVDVRVIAASHVNLPKAVKDGRFREDLFFRLNILKIKVPALRERPDDLRPLVIFFQRKYGFSSKVFLMSAIKKLEAYAWPGNIRELEAEMQRLQVVVKGDRIEPIHLDPKFFLEENQVGHENQIKDYSDLEIVTVNLERKLIRSVYRKVRSLKLTAEILGIAYSTLKNKVKSFTSICT